MYKMKKKHLILLVLSLVAITLAAITTAKPVVNELDCSGCGDCVDYCPVAAISLQDNKAVIDADKCIDCKICLSICQKNAIE